MSFLPLFLQAANAAGASGAAAGTAAGAGIVTFLPFILIILIMYFLMIRPQNKKQKETQKMLDALKKGDKVITIGGIHGTVSNVKDDTVTVKVDDNCRIEFNRSAIASVVNPKPVVEMKADKDKKDKDSKSGGSPEKTDVSEDKKDE
ncbi:MAG: preprotein translocase subunit YajC [Treponema sp.]|nr:preprotein translocase subunit YajC [Treponema sp.]MBQ7166848.1 preprotein translocase subunit YajC [Treponema sp.]